jgi:hypothetical protein
MKKGIVILSTLLIIVGIYAIGVGAIRENKKEKNLVILSQQLRQKELKQLSEKAKTLSLTSDQAFASEQDFDEEKMAFNKMKLIKGLNKQAEKLANEAEALAKQGEASRLAKLAADKAKQVANNNVYKPYKAKTPVNYRTPKVPADKAKEEAERLAKEEADKLAKGEEDSLSKEEADRIANEEADKLSHTDLP